jgi:hypothetical protein
MIPATERSADERTGAKAPQRRRECVHLAAVRNTSQGLRGGPLGQVTSAGGSGSKGSLLSRRQSLPWHAEGSDPVPPVALQPRTCPRWRMPVAQTSADGFALATTGPLPADMPRWHDHSRAIAALLAAANLMLVNTGRSSALSRVACGRLLAAVTVPVLARKGGTGR